MDPEVTATLRKMVLNKGARLVEYRIPLPMELPEYQVAQLFHVAQASEKSTGGGQGVEVLENKEVEHNGKKVQYTEKVYRVAHQLPRVITALVSKDKLEFKEIAYNGFPDQRTYSFSEHGDAFRLELVSAHFQDNGKQENVHGLDKDLLAKREVINIDIAAPHAKEYTKETDPALWKSEKTGRGPLEPGTWMDRKDIPVMTCYKLVAMQLKWFGFQSIVQNTFIKYQKNMFIKFHREMVTSMDDWQHMSMADIRAYEEEVQKKLAEAIKSDEIKLYTSTEVDDKSPTAADASAAAAAAATPAEATTTTTESPAPAETSDKTEEPAKSASPRSAGSAGTGAAVLAAASTTTNEASG